MCDCQLTSGKPVWAFFFFQPIIDNGDCANWNLCRAPKEVNMFKERSIAVCMGGICMWKYHLVEVKCLMPLLTKEETLWFKCNILPWGLCACLILSVFIKNLQQEKFHWFVNWYIALNPHYAGCRGEGRETSTFIFFFKLSSFTLKLGLSHVMEPHCSLLCALIFAFLKDSKHCWVLISIKEVHEVFHLWKLWL